MNSPLVASQDPALVPKQMPTSPTVELAVTSSALADARVRTRTTVDGIQFDRVDLAQATRVTLELAAAKGPALVVTPNLDILRLCHEQPRLRDMVNDADLVLPDGWPVLAAARLMHKPHSTPSTRVPGSELLWTVSAGAARLNMRVAVVGGLPGTAQKAAQKLGNGDDQHLFRGFELPHGFEQRPEDIAVLAEALDEWKPAIVLLGMGFPRQELLAIRLARRTPACFVGVGAGVDFAAGTKRRAPQIMQRLGLEWLHRLLSEPRRLWRRYLLADLPYATRLFAAAITHRARCGDRGPSAEIYAEGFPRSVNESAPS